MAKAATVGAPDTIICSACWSVVPTGSHFCSSCGAQVSTSVTGTQRLAALLSEANLYRMRARWLDAENRCIEAMRLDPNNVDAHSLLGDIYRDQGKLDEAAQWYQLALDLNPNSVGDKAKLAEVAKQQKKPVMNPGVIKQVSGTPSPYGTQKLLGLPPSTWLQGITAVAVVFVVIVIGVAIAMRSGRTDAETVVVPKAAAGPVGSPVPSSGAPQVTAPDVSAPRARQGPSPNPVMPGTSNNMPIASAVQPEEEGSPPEEDSAEPAPSRKAVVKTVPVGATDYEKTLRAFVAGRAQLSRDISLGAVMVDPRHPRASIVVSIAPRRSDLHVTRGIAIRTATRVAVAGFAGDPVLNTITVNVRLKSGGDRFVPVFAGDADRTAAQALPENPSLEQMMAAYSSYWWAPAYAPPGMPQTINGPTPVGAP